MGEQLKALLKTPKYYSAVMVREASEGPKMQSDASLSGNCTSDPPPLNPRKSRPYDNDRNLSYSYVAQC